MPDAHSNFAYSTVATAPSPASSGTSLVVATGDGALFPAVPFNATIWPATSQPLSTNAEIVRVTNISSDTLTITRAQESSSARTVVVGDKIAATITKKTFTDIETDITLKAPLASPTFTGAFAAATSSVSLATAALGAKTAGYTIIDIANATTLSQTTNNALTFNGIALSPAFTYTSGISGTFIGANFSPTVTSVTAQGAFAVLWSAFWDGATVQPTTGSASLFTGNIFSFNAQPTIKSQDTNAQTLSVYNGFRAAAALSVPASGSLTITTFIDFLAQGSVSIGAAGTLTVTSWYGFQSNPPAIATGMTVTTLTNFLVTAPSVSGTLTTWIGLDVPAMTGATTNIGIRCVPQAQFGTSASTTIAVDGTMAISTQALGTKTADFNVATIAAGTTATLGTTNSIVFNALKISPSVTVGGSSALLQDVRGVYLNATVTTATSQVVGGWTGFYDNTTITSATGSINMASTYFSANLTPTFSVADAHNQIVTTYTGVNLQPTLTPFSGTGTLTISSFFGFNLAQVTIPTNATITTLTGFRVVAPSVSGTLTNWIGLDIQAFSSAATINAGIRNLSALLQQGGLVFTPTTVTVSSNAGTVPVTASNAKFTNSSAATMTITMATTGAADGQVTIVRVYDATNVTQTITWVNTENGEGTAPTTSAGSTTLPKTVVFMFNSSTSKWRCIIT